MSGAVPAMGYPYEMVSVSVGRSEVPAGAEAGSEWHRYVIAHGDQRINGCRQGSLAVVIAAVEKIVVQLNDRRLSKGGRTHIVLRGRRPASRS